MIDDGVVIGVLPATIKVPNDVCAFRILPDPDKIFIRDLPDNGPVGSWAEVSIRSQIPITPGWRQFMMMPEQIYALEWIRQNGNA